MKGDVKMSKTDKELTIEVANAFITSWFSRDNLAPLKGKDVTGMIKTVYQTVKSLDDNKE